MSLVGGWGVCILSHRFLPGPPEPPTAVVATGDNLQAFVSWTPAEDYQQTVTEYSVSAIGDGWTGDVQTVMWNGLAAAAPSITFVGLAKGVTYTFTVTAATGAGVSPASAASAVGAFVFGGCDDVCVE